MILTNHLFGPLVFACSQTMMNRYSEAEKQKIFDAAKFAQAYQRAVAPKKEKEAIDSLVKQGVKVIDMDVDIFEKDALKVRQRLAEELGASEILKEIERSR